MKKIIAIAATMVLLLGVGCAATTTSESGSSQIFIESVDNTDKITLGDTVISVPLDNWSRNAEDLQMGVVAYLNNQDKEAELGVLYTSKEELGVDLAQVSSEAAIESLKKEILADETLEIVSEEVVKIKNYSGLLICYNEEIVSDSAEEATSEMNQTNIFLLASDTGIIMVALIAPETTEPYLQDFNELVASVTFV